MNSWSVVAWPAPADSRVEFLDARLPPFRVDALRVAVLPDDAPRDLARVELDPDRDLDALADDPDRARAEPALDRLPRVSGSVFEPSDVLPRERLDVLLLDRVVAINHLHWVSYPLTTSPPLG
jgi:hypothetical protein